LYVVQYRSQGRRRKQRIGWHGQLTTEQARTMARQWLASVATGRDPASIRDALQHGPTVADLATRYLEQHAHVKKKPSAARTDAYNIRLHILPRLGSRTLATITRDDIAALHHAMQGIPGAANRCLSLLSKMFNLAEQWNLRPQGTNPVHGITRYRERQMQRFLSEAELHRVGDALREADSAQLESPYALAAIKLLLYTGARVNEVLTLRWEQVDLPHGLAFLADSKTGAKPLYLPPPALEVVQTLPRQDGNPYVLCGRKPGGHFVGLARPWYRLRKRAGLPDVRLHDLRHTFGAWGASSGLSLPILGRLLGHRHPATTQRYSHLADNPVQQAGAIIAAAIVEAMEGEGG
jgi:integrase